MAAATRPWQRLRVPEEEVVDVDDQDALDEAGELAVAAVGEAERHAQHREDEAGEGNRELLLNLHHRVVRGDPLLLQLHDERPQLGDRHFAVALGRAAPGKDGLRIEAEHELAEPRHAVVLGRVGLARVLRAVLEDEFHRPPVAIQDHAPAVRQVDDRVVRVGGVRQEDVPPDSASGGHIADEEHAVREVLEEDAGLDLALGPLGDDVVPDFPGRLVRVGDGPDHHVERRGGGQDPEQDGRPEDAGDADAAGLEGDPFAVAREPAEADQQTDQQRHRDGDGEGLRQQGHHEREDGGGRGALGDERFGQLDEERQGQHEGEDQERHQEGRDDAADDVAVEESEHTLGDTIPHAETGAGAGPFWAPTVHQQGCSGAELMTSDNVCYVNLHIERLQKSRVFGRESPSGAPGPRPANVPSGVPG